MKATRHGLKALILIALLSFVAQFGFVSIASATPGSADLQAGGFSGFYGEGSVINVCNQGDDPVESFTLNPTLSGVEISEYIVTTSDDHSTDPTDFGSITQSGVWTGLVAATQCVPVMLVMNPTVAIGQDFSYSVEIASSKLQGGTDNVDPNSGNNVQDFGTFTHSELPDWATSTRLTTPGAITNGSTVDYEVTLTNNGPGIEQAGPDSLMNISFIVPEFASYQGVTDLDTNDALDINTAYMGGCTDFGPVGNAGAGIAYLPGEIVVCFLKPNADIGPGESFKFNFEMTATNEFTTGALSVYAIATGSDLDSFKLQQGLSKGDDVFTTLAGVNNITTLQYDNSDLQVNVDRCSGQGETTTDGTGCFQVTFNKKIYAPSFTTANLDLQGADGANVTLEQMDDFTWQVHLTGIAQGSTVSLEVNQDGILDYNAVPVTVQVLGENTIRFASDSGSGSGGSTSGSTADGVVAGTDATHASGVLSATGANVDTRTPIVLIALGLMLLGSVALSRRREKVIASK
jgi:hypothetical protein